MKKITKLAICLLSVMALTSTVLAGLTFNKTPKTMALDSSSYVELYSPLGEAQAVSGGGEYLKLGVEDFEGSPNGKVLAMDYKPGHTKSIDVAIPVESRDSEGFQGLAMWVDVPETDDEYSFTLYVVKQTNDWQVMELGSPLTLVSADGVVTNKTSIWKRQQLNGFTGWVIMPEQCYKDAAPEAELPYRFIIMFEKETAEGADRTTPIKISLGSIGYYIDYDAFLYETAGAEVMDEYYSHQLNGYIEQIQLLSAKSEEQLVKKNKMLVYFANIKENLKTLPLKEKVEIAKTLASDYSRMMQDYRYGAVKETPFVMSFALTSDTHFTNKWVNDQFVLSLADAKELDPDLAAMIVLGDLSDNGISPTNPDNTELDNYYDWVQAQEYKNSKGEDIPIYSIMGNHDVRGPFSEGYPQDAYQPAVDYYIEREGCGSLQWDTWINGYHFIFLNTDKYHSDNCYLSEESLLWLDKTLGENEDGKPIFVMVHQPLGNVFAMEGSSVTFEEVIAKHPTAVVSSGHTHSHFGVAKITNEGNGVFINQPAMVVALAQYYFVEVYEGGVIYRARQASNDSWIVDCDVVVSNDDRRVNPVYVAQTATESDLVTENLNAELVAFDGVSPMAMKLEGTGSASFRTVACGEIENYAGYSLFAFSEKAVKVSIDGNGLKAGESYYLLEDGELITQTVGANGEIYLNGWVVIPKEAIDGSAHPVAGGTFTIALGEEQVVYVDRISYYFDKNSLFEAIYNLNCSFFSEGKVVSSYNAVYGTAVRMPTAPAKEETQAYTYEFIGWDLNADGNVDEIPAVLNGSINAVAVYKANIKQYTLTLLDSDGSVISQSSLDYGTVITTPKLNGLFGWDLTGDGAVESLPATLTESLTATAVYGEKQYENGNVVFDAGAVSNANFHFYSYSNSNYSSLLKGYSSTIEHAAAPSERVARFEYNYSANYIPTSSNSSYVRLYMPYYGEAEGFFGYAIWVDIPATSEAYVGGLRFNGDSRINPATNGWTLIDSEGNVTYQNSKWESVSTFPEIATGFTGWILVDRTTFSEELADITPKEDGFLTFQIDGLRRTSSYVMNIGQVLYYSENSKEALISELSAGVEKTTAMYTFKNSSGFIYKSGIVEKGDSIDLPANPVHEDPDMFFAGWDTDFDGLPNEVASSITISKNFNAIAVFYHKEAYETIFDGQSNTLKINSGKYTTLTPVTYADSPTGIATKVDVNPKNKDMDQYQHLTIDIPGYREAEGIAVWIDASNQPSFRLGTWINFSPKHVIADGGDYGYWIDESGVITKDNSWQNATVPANFKGWFVMPLSMFRLSVLMPGDVLRLAVAYTTDGKYNPVNASYQFHIGECVIFNCNVEDFMAQIEQRVYTFEDHDGSVIARGVLAEGQKLPVPANPVREDFAFLGWDINNDGKVDTLPETSGRNIVARAIYKSEKYLTYKFVEEDGTVVLERTALYGSLILPPFRYVKTEGIYNYIPSYGDYEEGMILTENVEFTVTYTKEIRRLTYSFVVDGVIVETKTVDYGTVIEAPSAPTKPNEEHYRYEFAGWAGFSEGMTADNDYVFEAQFNKVANKYTVTFISGGQVHHSEQLDYGTKIVLPLVPEKAPEAQYVFVFSGWTGYYEGITVTGDITFEAVFDKEVKICVITFVDSDGITVIQTKRVPYGSRVNPPTAPYKEGYEFVEWKDYYGMAEVTEDATYMAVYRAIGNNDSSIGGGDNSEVDSSKDSQSGSSGSNCKSSVLGFELAFVFMIAGVVIIARKKRANS